MVEGQSTTEAGPPPGISLEPSDVEVLFLAEDGATSRASQSVDGGTYQFTGVDSDEYYLRIGRRYLVRETSSVEHVFVQLGRADRLVTSESSTLNVSLDGLNPWQADDRLRLFSPGASMSVAASSSTGFAPPPGTTELENASLSLPAETPRVEFDKGDSVHVFQQVHSLQQYGEVWSAEGSLKVTTEGPGGVEGTLEKGDHFSTELAFSLPVLTGLVEEQGAEMEAGAGCRVVALPEAGRHGLFATGGEVFRLRAFPDVGDARADFFASFPTDWLRVTCGGFFYVPVEDPVYGTLPVPGGMHAEFQFADSARYEGVPLVEPVQEVNLVEDVREDRTILALDWSPPPGGSPTHYIVELMQMMQVDEVVRSLQAIAIFETPHQRLLIPDGILAPGWYVVRITSVMESDWAMARASYVGEILF